MKLPVVDTSKSVKIFIFNPSSETPIYCLYVAAMIDQKFIQPENRTLYLAPTLRRPRNTVYDFWPTKANLRTFHATPFLDSAMALVCKALSSSFNPAGNLVINS